MYEELEIKSKNEQFEWYSPINEMKLEVEGDVVKVSWYGTLSLFTDEWNIKDIEYMKINKCKDYNILESKIIFNDNINKIVEFDNLSNSTYGILK